MSDIFSRIRNLLRHKQFLINTYVIFLVGFYISPNNHLHRNFYYLFVLLPFFIAVDRREIQNCIRSRIFKLSLIFLVFFLLSMFWTDGDITGEEYYDIVRYFLMLVCFILVTMYLAADSDQFLEKLQFWLCLVAMVAAIIFILVFYASHNFPAARVKGPFSYNDNENQAAMFFGFAGILALYSALSSKQGRHKLFYGCCLFVIFGYMLLSQSRGPTFAFIMCLCVGLALEKNWKAIALIVVLSIGFLCLIEFGSTGISSFLDRGLGYRKTLWLETLNRIGQAPILGEGFFTDVNTQVGWRELSPHNLFLLVTLKSGVIGGGLLIVLVLTALVYSYRFFSASGNWIYLGIFIYFIICMTFDSTHLLYKPTLGWLIFWLPISLIAVEELRRIQKRSSHNLHDNEFEQ